jgi:hypothetical protein
VTLSVIVTVLGLATAVWLAYRVLVNPLAQQHVGAVIGLICACALVAGAFLSMRQEGIAPADEQMDVPTVRPGTGVPS